MSILYATEQYAINKSIQFRVDIDRRAKLL